MPVQDKSRQLNGRLAEENWSDFRELALQAGMPGKEHAFASLVLNLVVECARASQMTWDDFKQSIPGYETAQALRRARLSKREDTEQDWLRRFYLHLPAAQRRRKMQEIARAWGFPEPLPEDPSESAARAGEQAPLRPKAANSRRGR